MGICARCGEDNPARARFCLACGVRLGDVPAAETRKTITVLFADLIDSTALGEGVDPEALRAVMGRYYGEMRSTVEAYGGTVEKFIGDAVVGVFGIPVAHEDDALRAVRAGIDLQRAMSRLADELEPTIGRRLTIRVAINTGEVVAGSDVEGAAGVVGDPINTAARMEKVAPPGGVVIGDATRRLVQRATIVRPLGRVALPGRTSPVEVFAVDDVALDLRDSEVGAALIGRERELDALKQAFDRVVDDRSCTLFTLLGAAGVGKSRLVREFVRSLDGRSRVLRGRCLPYGEGITFWPVMEVIGEAAGISDRDSKERALARIAAVLDGDEEASAITLLVGQAVGLVQADGGQEAIFWGVRRLVEAIAAREPLVVVFDDIHWGEQVFLDLVDHLVEWSRDVPLLVVCLARPELLETRAGWAGGKLNSVTMLLDALRGTESLDLLASLLGGDAGDVVQALSPVLEVAEGNPLYLEETIAMLVEDGTLRREGERWIAPRDLESLQIPPTIHALLTARLDQLPPDERAALEVASVAGKVFSAGDVARLLEGPDVRSTFESLARKGLVRRDASQTAGGDWYRFRHILIRDAAYQCLPKARRAALHERYAAWLEEVLGPRSQEYGEVIGYHLEQSAKSLADLGKAAPTAVRAAETLTSAAGRAADRGDVRAAESLLNRAALLVVDGTPLWAEVHLELGSVLREAGRFAEAVAAFASVETSPADLDGQVRALAKLRREESTIHVNAQVTAEETQRVAEDAFDTFRRGDNLVGMAEAMRLLAFAYDTMGRSNDSQTCLRRAISYAEDAGDVRRASSYRRTLMGSMSWGPIPVPDLIEETQQFVEWARAQSDRRSEARGHAVLGSAYASCGRLEEARRSIELQKRLHGELGLEMARAWCAFESAWVEILAGDLAAAEAELRWATGVCEREGEQAVLPTLLGVLADVVFARGDVEEADLLAQRVARMSAADDILSQVKWRTVRAKVAAARGDATAKQLVDEAVDLADTIEYLDWRALAHLDRARVLDALEEPGVEHELAAAGDLFARKGMTAAIDYSRRVALSELRRPATSTRGAAGNLRPRAR